MYPSTADLPLFSDSMPSGSTVEEEEPTVSVVNTEDASTFLMALDSEVSLMVSGWVGRGYSVL